jgi:hypothetical protein
MLPYISVLDILLWLNTIHMQGRIQGGGAHPARAPPKFGKSMIFFA